MKTIYIESEFNSFEDFHDKEWINKLLDTSKGSQIHDEVENFCTHWWGTARAFVLPWLLVDGVYEAIKATIPIIDKTKQDYWDYYLKRSEFRGALWKVAEGAYTSLYYAYENLVVSLLNIGLVKSLRVSESDAFRSELRKKLGERLADKVWNDNRVAVAREVRHSLVHCGGKATSTLKKMKPRLRIENGDVLVSPVEVRKLYSDLKPRVELLVKHYLKSGRSAPF